MMTSRPRCLISRLDEAHLRPGQRDGHEGEDREDKHGLERPRRPTLTGASQLRPQTRGRPRG